jgi:hypothetical protein
MDFVGRVTVKYALLYFDNRNKNKPVLTWSGTETMHCYVCFVPVCLPAVNVLNDSHSGFHGVSGAIR